MAARPAARNAVAALIVGTMLLAGAAMWWVGQRKIDLLNAPITLSLAVDDQIWVGHGGALHRLDRNGDRLERVTMPELGMPEPLSHLHAVRADDLLASAGKPTRLYRCTPSLRQCRLADSGYIERFGRFKLALWIGANADGSKVVVTDNGAHRVAVLDADGKLLAHEGGAVGRFNYPAQPVWRGDNSIWLAAADAKRIERFEFTGNALTPAMQLVPTPTHDSLLAGRDWPMALAPLGDGRWWAVIQYDMMKPGGLLRFGDTGRFDGDARLPPGADLTAVTRLGDGLVVADLHGPTLWRLNLDGRDAQPFGDSALRNELRADAVTLVQLDEWRRWITAALIGIPVLGLLLLLAMGERTPQTKRFEPPDFAVPAPRGKAERVEIGLTDALLKQARQLRWMSIGLLAFMLAGVAWLAIDGKLPPVAVGAAMVVFAIQELAMWWLLKRQRTQRLEVEGGSVRLMFGDKPFAQAKLADCWCDGRTLMIGTHRVMVFTAGGEPAFEPIKLQAHVLAAIPRHQWTTPGKLELRNLRESWRRRPLLSVLTWVGVVAMLVACAWVTLPR